MYFLPFLFDVAALAHSVQPQLLLVRLPLRILKGHSPCRWKISVEALPLFVHFVAKCDGEWCATVCFDALSVLLNLKLADCRHGAQRPS